jgi:hypothetical protein
MIQLQEVSVYGLSSAGPFQGTLNFYPGLQVITARTLMGSRWLLRQSLGA